MEATFQEPRLLVVVGLYWAAKISNPLMPFSLEWCGTQKHMEHSHVNTCFLCLPFQIVHRTLAAMLGALAALAALAVVGDVSCHVWFTGFPLDKVPGPGWTSCFKLFYVMFPCLLPMIYRGMRWQTWFKKVVIEYKHILIYVVIVSVWAGESLLRHACTQCGVMEVDQSGMRLCSVALWALEMPICK